MVQVLCKLCQKEFYAKPAWLKKGNGIYCSAKCHHTDSRTGKMVICGICKKETYKTPKALQGSKSGKFFCSKSCQTVWRNTEFMNDLRPNWKGGRSTYRRLMLNSNIEQKCTLCHLDDIRILAVHHIDEDRSNNTLENFAWLCHNCHHLVHRYPDEHKKFMAVIV